MPSKKKGPAEQKSKKAIAEAKRIRAADQTFGIKNKSKGAKAKQHVKRVEQSLTGNEEARMAKMKDDKKAKRAQREAEEREERALFSETTDVLRGDKKKAVVKQKEDPALSAEVQKALVRAKELFDAGAMSMDDYVSYREQILAADSESEADEDEGDADDDADDASEDASAEEAEPEPEPEPEDPRLTMKVADLYLEECGDIDLDALPDDDAE